MCSRYTRVSHSATSPFFKTCTSVFLLLFFLSKAARLFFLRALFASLTPICSKRGYCLRQCVLVTLESATRPPLRFLKLVLLYSCCSFFFRKRRDSFFYARYSLRSPLFVPKGAIAFGNVFSLHSSQPLGHLSVFLTDSSR